MISATISGLLFGALTHIINQLHFPGQGTISLIVGTAFGWIVWPFIVAFFLTSRDKVQVVRGALLGFITLESAVVSYYILSDVIIAIFIGEHIEIFQVFLSIKFWAVLGAIIGPLFGLLGAGAKNKKWTAYLYILVSAVLISVERIDWYTRELSYPYPKEPKFYYSLPWSFAVLAVVVLFMAAYHVRGKQKDKLPAEL